MTDTNAIVMVQQQSHIEPQNIPEALVLAGHAVKSRLFSGASTPEAALVILLTGRGLGMDAMSSLRAIHVIDGKPTLAADAMIGLCLRSKLCEHFETIESTPLTCTVEAKRVGRPARQLTFTIEDARRAKLLDKGEKSGWAKFPAAMLRARAKSALARDVFPDVVMGIYDPDEINADAAQQQQPGPVVTLVNRRAPYTTQATPHVAVDDGEPAPLSFTAISLAARLNGAQSAAEAKALAGEARASTTLTKEEKAYLWDTYKSALAAFPPVPAAVIDAVIVGDEAVAS